MEYVITFIAGMAVAALIIRWMARTAIERLLKKLEQEMSQPADAAAPGSMELKVELAGNQFLCYNSSTMDFVCQGSDIVEITKNFRKRYPNRNASLISDNTEVMKVLHQQKSLLDNETSTLQ